MREKSQSAFGTFLDDLPKALYVLAHIAFLVIGIWLWSHASTAAVARPGALLLYVASQAVFFGFFANWITFKMAVLVEQMLMLVMVCAIAVSI